MLLFVVLASTPVSASPRDAVLALARTAYACAVHSGAAADTGILTVIDYDRPSVDARLAVVDLRASAVLMETRVAHGRNSGDDQAVAFSNVSGSNESSVGLYRTGETYTGKHGRSLTLDGLEPGWNDHARARAIVVHAADYATEAFVLRWGRLGRSLGCPALDPAVSDTVIDKIRGGTLVFAYHADAAWLATSRWLACSGADPAGSR